VKTRECAKRGQPRTISWRDFVALPRAVSAFGLSPWNMYRTITANVPIDIQECDAKLNSSPVEIVSTRAFTERGVWKRWTI
jgi:hypothetical protein